MARVLVGVLECGRGASGWWVSWAVVGEQAEVTRLEVPWAQGGILGDEREAKEGYHGDEKAWLTYCEKMRGCVRTFRTRAGAVWIATT